MNAELNVGYETEYQAEPHRQQWELYADELKSKGIPQFLYSLSPDLVYQELRLTYAACGFPTREDLDGKSALIIGAAPGFDVRISRDLGLNAIGVDTEKEVVEAGQQIGLVRKVELIVVSAQQFMTFLQQSQVPKIDMIISRNLLLISLRVNSPTLCVDI